MGQAASPGQEHGALMDSIYRGQRHIYDATRKFYLFGRDTLIDRLDCTAGERVLEVACGTGRNLHRIGMRWPGTALHGLDISCEMLKSADARLGRAAKLAEADATSFDPQALFGCQRFDRIVLSYCLSMIPGWQAALDHAAGMLGPDGSLHIVDFGSLEGMPWPLRPALQRWLAQFHVSPRMDLDEIATAIARRHGLECHLLRGPLDYFRLVTLVRPE